MHPSPKCTGPNPIPTVHFQDRPVWTLWTVRFIFKRPSSFRPLDRPLSDFRTVHFRRPSSLSHFWPPSLTHDRPLWVVKTVHFHPMTVHFRPDPKKLRIFQQHSFHFRNVLFISATFFLIQQHSYYFSNILFVSATFQGMLLKIFSATCSARWVRPN